MGSPELAAFMLDGLATCLGFAICGGLMWWLEREDTKP